MRRTAWAPALGVAYVAAIAALGGLKADHVFIGSLGLLDLYNERSRLFLRSFAPFILTGVVYDATRYFYERGIAGRVHVVEPYDFELAWFGVAGRTLNELFLEHHWPLADLLAGFAYLTYVGEYLALAFLAFWRRRDDVARTLARVFLVVNVMGFVTYFAYPAAPPWYVTKYGFGPARTDIAADPAAATRFDQLLGTNLFDAMYGRSIDVFGAYPSLHVAYPFAAALVVFAVAELRWARWPAVAFFLLVSFSAVYLQHHYVTDVVLGVLYAGVAVAAVRRFERSRRT
jgi:membrane-associated phospholipid phosphatase